MTDKSKLRDDSSLLIKLYMMANQAAYAIVAFPIGTVLSIAPVYLFEEKGVDVETIGYMMAAGELLGICAMKLAERSENGFVFRRPYDLYFINAALALSVIMIPVWPVRLWYLSGASMILVQTFNSSSKPVVGESIHRLAIMADKEPNKIFAQANMWRRIGNGTVGGLTPLIFAVVPTLSFYLIGGIIFVFLVFLVMIDFKIKSIFKTHRKRYPECQCRRRSNEPIDTLSTLRLSMRKISSLEIEAIKNDIENDLRSEEEEEEVVVVVVEEETTISLRLENTESTDDGSSKEGRSLDDNLQNFVMASMERMIYGSLEDGSETNSQESSVDFVVKSGDDSTDTSTEESLGTTSLETATQESLEEGSENDESLSTASKSNEGTDPRSLDGYLENYLYFLIVHAFPFWDAAISRLPFAFLTIAIVNDYLASGVLFGYQMGRAIAQSIQVRWCDPRSNYILNGVAFCAYLAFVVYTEVVSDGYLWYVPILFTGLAETLPIQQYYLLGLFGDVNENDMELRNAVKASHTGTGIGSMVAFLAASQVYGAFGVSGVACLGLSVMIAKLATNLQIDYLHTRKKTKEERLP